jgi:hypothetical protein
MADDFDPLVNPEPELSRIGGSITSYIHTAPINLGPELKSIRVDICGIESTSTNEDACNEMQDIDTQNLLLAGAARSDDFNPLMNPEPELSRIGGSITSYIHTAPINLGPELKSIRVDICGIESTSTNEDACNEMQDIDTQNLLLTGAACSDRAQVEVADGEAFYLSRFQTKASCSVQQASKSPAGCCPMPKFNQTDYPFLGWLWESNPRSGLLGFCCFSSAPTSCWFEMLNLFVTVLLTFPALACDILIMICSVGLPALELFSQILLDNNKTIHRLPFLRWLWESNPRGGLLGFSSAPTSCWFETLNIFASVLLTFPALACDILIISLSAAGAAALMLFMCLYQCPQYALSLRYGYARARLRNTIKDHAFLVFITVISVVLMLSLAIPWVNPKGHTGPTVIEGSCNNRTRCDVTASCNVVSPSSYTCSCPEWLVGSGFDDDPCICRSAILSTPDFGRSICVTPLSHFTMPGLLGFIFGMTLFLIFALLGAAIGQVQVFFIWLLLVLFAASGRLNPSIQDPFCGVSSFDAQVCLKGQFCVDNACSWCAAPDRQSWDEVSGKCIDGVAGNCTAHSCASLPGSTCIQKQNQFVHYHVCAKSVTSSSSVPAAPGVAALVFAVFMAMMT